ncbi:hypothetical protein BDQ17DRAFT_1345477 [Cyathus striatus]|nr:hypothetical protein BDQ17DRAFT_1345477 [Cyathus striatus]
MATCRVMDPEPFERRRLPWTPMYDDLLTKKQVFAGKLPDGGIWITTYSIQGVEYGRGNGRTKKQSDENAAHQTLINLKLGYPSASEWYRYSDYGSGIESSSHLALQNDDDDESAPDTSGATTPDVRATDNNLVHSGNGIPETLQEVPTFMEETTDERPSSSSSENDTENDHPEAKAEAEVTNEEIYGEISDVREEHETTDIHTDIIHLSSPRSNQYDPNLFEDVLSGKLAGTSGLFQNAHHFEIHGSSFSDQSVNLNAGNGYSLAAGVIITSIWHTALESFKSKCFVRKEISTSDSHYQFKLDSNDAGVSLNFKHTETQHISQHLEGTRCDKVTELTSKTAELQSLSFTLYTRHFKSLTSAKSMALWGFSYIL